MKNRKARNNQSNNQSMKKSNDMTNCQSRTVKRNEGESCPTKDTEL